MPNADQCGSMPIKILALIPMLINSDQFLSMLINANQCFNDALIRHWSALICIERNWSELISIDRQWSVLRGIDILIYIDILREQCHDFDRHWSSLGIDRGCSEKATTSIPAIDILRNDQVKQNKAVVPRRHGPDFHPRGTQFIWDSGVTVFPQLKSN